MKRILYMIAFFLLALVPLKCAMADTRIMVISDTHVLAPELFEGSDLFIQALRAGDGKYTQHSEELMQGLLEEVKHQKPDALVLTGDLTFNGEKASHLWLKGWLRRIEAETGTNVWVIPGNHDINSPSTRRFEGDAWYPAPNLNADGFQEIYLEFLGDCDLQDEAGFTYMVPVGDRVALVLMDVSFYEPMGQTFGVYMSSHDVQVREMLKEAASEGRTVITGSHHSLVAQSSFARESFQMFGWETCLETLRRAGVQLHVSGHLHIQHLMEQDGVTDAATGAFSVSPHRFAMIEIRDDGSIDYEARALCAEHLPEGFQEESARWFCEITKDKNRKSMDPSIPEEEREQMLDLSARFNLAYFSGTFRSDDPSWKQDPGWALWQEKGENVFARYLDMVSRESLIDNLRWSSR
ncbi:MAG: metallophosphoesterase [Clostridia bacterium]|nr:metallophosphoesterase [Clostridia bacterium]